MAAKDVRFSGDARDRIVEVVRDLIEVAVLDALRKTRGIDVDDEADPLVHRDGHYHKIKTKASGMLRPCAGDRVASVRGGNCN